MITLAIGGRERERERDEKSIEFADSQAIDHSFGAYMLDKALQNFIAVLMPSTLCYNIHLKCLEKNKLLCQVYKLIVVWLYTTVTFSHFLPESLSSMIRVTVLLLL